MAIPTRVVTRGSMTTAESQPTSADGIVGVPAGSLDWSLIEDRFHARWEFIAKRCLDLIVAVPLALVLAALYPLFALAIRLDSPGPIGRSASAACDCATSTLAAPRTKRHAPAAVASMSTSPPAVEA